MSPDMAGFGLNCKTLPGQGIPVAWARNFLSNHIHKKAQLEGRLKLGLLSIRILIPLFVVRVQEVEYSPCCKTSSEISNDMKPDRRQVDGSHETSADGDGWVKRST